MRVARVTAKFYLPDQRRRDPDNLLGSLKAAIDGLVDGGVIGDDRDFIHMPVEQYVDRARPRVEIEVEEVGA
ncbi:MAG: RusA family crossover junction endodeoxyribonuclease [Planctomycetota bacterium]|nr:RusA family crossover junction endodeoxyribonuclease [Planctomycetota bacterium]